MRIANEEEKEKKRKEIATAKEVSLVLINSYYYRNIATHST